MWLSPAVGSGTLAAFTLKSCCKSGATARIPIKALVCTDNMPNVRKMANIGNDARSSVAGFSTKNGYIFAA